MLKFVEWMAVVYTLTPHARVLSTPGDADCRWRTAARTRRAAEDRRERRNDNGARTVTPAGADEA
ncbi:MAG TPA: hypothetical protein VNE58_07070 [Casimicrobiaceae bacterium]|nr:hypothetical protein [Casimicrobiaceae bacterium]